jgi:hypothetical protein
MMIYLGTLTPRTLEVVQDANPPGLNPSTVYFRLDDENGGIVVFRLPREYAKVLASKIIRACGDKDV